MSQEYCRAVERHLCQKNDGHLIRVVGPAFEVVSQWERDGVPLKLALRGIDRYFERRAPVRPRRRPVRIEFCDADVRDVFDEWRRALGLVAAPAEGVRAASPAGEPSQAAGSGLASRRAGSSLRLHLERAALRLSSADALGRLGAGADALIERLSAELDRARTHAGGLRGDARAALLARLVALDRDLMGIARSALEAAERATIDEEARLELEPYRARLSADRYQQALSLAVDRLVRERAGLPVLVFD